MHLTVVKWVVSWGRGDRDMRLFLSCAMKSIIPYPLALLPKLGTTETISCRMFLHMLLTYIGFL
jgi:hypothetical protein